MHDMDPDRESGLDQTRRQHLWMVVCRFFLAAICLGVIQVRGADGAAPSVNQPAYLLLLGVCALNVIYLALTRLITVRRAYLLGQSIVDLFLVSALVYLTGGAVSHFPVLYFAAIVGGGIVAGCRRSMLLASLATVLLAAVSAVSFVGAHLEVPIPFVDAMWFEKLRNLSERSVYGFLIAQGVGFHLVAFLTGRLVDRLSRATVVWDELLRNMSDGVIVLDAKGTIIFINDEFSRLVDLPSARAMIGSNVRKLPADPPLRSLLDSLVEKETRWREISFRGEHGLGKHLELRTSVVRGSEGQTIGVLADVTPLHRMRRARERADRLEAIAQMASGIAHEIRNPLASLRSCVQELDRMRPDDPDAPRLRNIVTRETDRVDEIVGEFLSFASMRPAKRKESDIAALLRDVGDLLQARFDSATIELDLQEPLRTMADPGQMKQVFLNLGINGLEAARDGKGKLEISARPVYDDVVGCAGRIAVIFRDDGCGMTEEVSKQIFNPFFTTKGGGTGMGLAVVRRIVSAHEGSIEIHSESGKGTRATVYLPASDLAARMDEKREQ